MLGDLELELAADECVGNDEAVERHVDRALGRVLDGHDAEVGAPPLDVVEHLDDRAGRAVRRRRAEVLERGLVGERRLGAQVRDGQRGFERAAAGQDLAPDGHDRLRGQRPVILLGETPDDVGFTLRGIGGRILTSFEVSDLEGGLGALGEEV